MRRLTWSLYVIVSLTEITSRITGTSVIHWICKPLIMIALALYYFQRQSTNRSIPVIMAIFFSSVGDIALMFELRYSQLFYVGLFAFLMAHVSYILAYHQHQYNQVAGGLQGIQKVRIAFPIVLASTGLVVILYPTLGALKVPVVTYALVLLGMVLGALFRYGRTNTQSFWMVFGGALSFMISDSILALDRFLTVIPYAGALVMTTYTLAQFLLIAGLCHHFSSKPLIDSPP